MVITGEERQRRARFAAYLKDAMRGAGFVRSNGELDVPALHRMSGVPDSILRRWLGEAGIPSVDNMRPVAAALGLDIRYLVAASGVMTAKELGLDGDPDPPRQPTPEERIMADDLLSDEDKSSLIHNYRTMRERRALAEESRHQKRS